MIYYTQTEGSPILVKLPFKTSHQKLMKRARKHRHLIAFGTRLEMTTLIQQPGMKPTLIVSSLFFIKNGRIKKIWDARTGKFRPIYKPLKRDILKKSFQWDNS